MVTDNNDISAEVYEEIIDILAKIIINALNKKEVEADNG